MSNRSFERSIDLDLMHMKNVEQNFLSSNKFIMTLYKGILQYEQQRDVTKYVFISTTVITSHQMDSWYIPTHHHYPPACTYWSLQGA